jgi:hypothetical protein
MIRYGRRALGDDPLAKITSEGESGPGSGTVTSTDAASVSSREDEDDMALVY